MPNIVPIVEGDGEIEAVPLLLRRLLEEEFERYDWQVKRPKNAHGCGNLTQRSDGIERYIKYAELEACDGILVLIDHDAINSLAATERPQDDCAADFARYLAQRVSAINPSVSVVVVIACREYESWFVASAETMGLSTMAPYQGNVDELRSPKSWIDNQLPPGQRYKETTNQVKMTAKINLELARQRSRSFRRLQSALEQLLQAHENGTCIVTPITPDEDRT